jgi:CBS domain containing-hemolysin-like protein
VGGYGFQVGLVVVLVLLNAAFSGSEMALISLRESQQVPAHRRVGRVGAALIACARMKSGSLTSGWWVIFADTTHFWRGFQWCVAF